MAGNNLSLDEGFEEVQLDDGFQDVPLDHAAPSVPSGPSKLESFLRGAGQGATMGFQDEGSSAIEYALGKLTGNEAYKDKSYKDLLAGQRQDVTQAREANPKSFLSGEIPGSVVGTAPFGGAFATAPIKTGLALGAAQGLGATESGSALGALGDTAKGAAIGGVIGSLPVAASYVWKKIQPTIENVANSLARRALGFSKGQINKLPGKYKEADSVARTLLEQGDIVKAKNSFQDMAEKVVFLKETAGKEIGSVLSTLDEQGQKIINPIDITQTLKAEWADIANEPLAQGMAPTMERILATIEKRGGQNITFEDAQQLKQVMKKFADFSKRDDTGNGELVRQAYIKVRDAIDGAVEKASIAADDPNLLSNFMQAKKNYGAAVRAEKALEDKISSRLGNRVVSLTDFITGGPVAASGNVGGGIAAVAGKRLIESRGLQAGAEGAFALEKVIPKMGKFAGAMSKTAQRGGPALAAHHYVMMQNDPEYSETYVNAVGSDE